MRDARSARLRSFQAQRGLSSDLAETVASRAESLAPARELRKNNNVEDDQVDTVVQPDVLIVSDPKKVDARGVRGAPDWVAEVLSPSTARHDQTVKLAAYERAGVREVWLIDPIDRTLTIYQLEAGYYGPATVLELKGQTSLTTVPGVTVDWALVLAEMS